jgi:transcriptional regulator with XRE-family HTH domain
MAVETSPDSVVDPAAVGAAVGAALKQSAVSQRQLADKLGISQQGISQRLLGRVEFKITELIAAAALLEVSLTDLLPSPVLAQPEHIEATA